MSFLVKRRIVPCILSFYEVLPKEAGNYRTVAITIKIKLYSCEPAIPSEIEALLIGMN
jgi:hypothetical protein